MKHERAVVVTRSDLVEQCSLDLDAERFPVALGHVDLAGEAPSIDLERHVGLIDEELVLDDVARGRRR